MEKGEDGVTVVTLERAEGGPIGWVRDGVVILEVEEDSAAAKAGVKKSVKILSVNDKEVTSLNLWDTLEEAGNSAKLSFIEVRMDESHHEGKMFTHAEFLSMYAAEGEQKWKDAKEAAVTPTPTTEQETPKTMSRNHAFVFVKPHANTEKVRELVEREFAAKGINVTSQGEITGEEIDSNLFIDQHYYAIASKATILKPHELNVPADKFKEKFGLDWEESLAKGIVYNAMDACKVLEVDAEGLDKIWAETKKAGRLVKFGGGFYCGQIIVEGKEPIYAFNGFFMQMRSKFTTSGTSIHYYTVDFCPETTSWEDFRGKVLGPTDPADAPEGSLRRAVFNDWKALGLAEEPNVGDNAVHASASPFEALAERMNWLKTPVSEDPFGKELLTTVSEELIKEWSVDPQVCLSLLMRVPLAPPPPASNSQMQHSGSR